MKVLVCYYRYPRLQLEPVAQENEVTDLNRIGCPVNAYVLDIGRRRWWRKVAPVYTSLTALHFEPVRKETDVPKIWRTYALLLVP